MAAAKWDGRCAYRSVAEAWDFLRGFDLAEGLAFTDARHSGVMVALEEPLVALRAWHRLVRAHRDATVAGRADEVELLQGRVERARSRYRVLARFPTTDYISDGVAAKAVHATATLRVVGSADGLDPH